MIDYLIELSILFRREREATRHTVNIKCRYKIIPHGEKNNINLQAADMVPFEISFWSTHIYGPLKNFYRGNNPQSHCI